MATLKINHQTFWLIIKYIDANLKAYYNTNIVDLIDEMNIDYITETDKRKLKILLRITLSADWSSTWIDKQLLLYAILFNFIHYIIINLKDALIEELSEVSEIAFEKERQGEINTQKFIKSQNTYKDIHKIITTISTIKRDDINTAEMKSIDGDMLLCIGC